MNLSLENAVIQLAIAKENVRVAALAVRKAKSEKRLVDRANKKNKITAIKEAKKILRAAKIKPTDDDLIRAVSVA